MSGANEQFFEKVRGNKVKYSEVLIFVNFGLNQPKNKNYFGFSIQVAKDLSVLITDNYKGKKYEEFARKKQIKDVSQMKQDLEKKLMTVEMELDLLKAREFSTPNNKNDFKIPAEKQKDIDEFIKKKATERKELERRRNDRVAKMLEDMRKKEEDLKNNESTVRESFKKERLERIQKNIDDIQERMKNREKETETWKNELKKLKKNAPPDPNRVFEETQKALLQKTVQEELSKIKEKAKPIDPDELKEFMKKHDEQLRVKKEEKLKELKDHRKDLKEREKELAQNSGSVFYSKAEEELAESMKQYQRMQESLQEKKQRIKSFEKKRKEKYLPTINEDKKEQVLTEIEKLRSHKVKRLISKKHADDKEPLGEWDPREAESLDPRTKGKEYLEYVKGLKKKENGGTRSAEDLSRIEEKAAGEKPEKKPINYMKDEKVRALLSKKNELKALKNIVDDSSVSENIKRDYIKAQAANWEEKARMKEEVLKLKPKKKEDKEGKEAGKGKEEGENNDEVDEINELYLNSVKAKLALFKGS